MRRIFLAGEASAEKGQLDQPLSFARLSTQEPGPSLCASLADGHHLSERCHVGVSIRPHPHPPLPVRTYARRCPQRNVGK
jgi:hypothetical protein